MAIKKIIEFVVKSKGAKKDVDNLNKSIKNTDKAQTTATQSTKGLNTSLKATSTSSRLLNVGLKAVSATMKAMGIGLIVAGVVKLTEALSKNQVIMDAVQDVMNTISFVIQGFVNALIDSYEAVKQNSDNFEALQKAGGALITLLLTPLKLNFQYLKIAVLAFVFAIQKALNVFGLVSDEAVEKTGNLIKEAKDNTIELIKEAGEAVIVLKDNAVDAMAAIGEMGDEMSERMDDAINKAETLAKQINDLQTLVAVEGARDAGRLAKLRNDAEELKRIRDDESKTFAERIKASEDYYDIIEKANAINIRQAQRELALANKELAANSSNEALIVKQIEATNKLAEVQTSAEKEKTRWFRRNQSLSNRYAVSLEELNELMSDNVDEETKEINDLYLNKLDLINKTITDEEEKNKLIEEARAQHNQALLNLEQSKQDSIEDIIEEVNRDKETFEEELARELEEDLLKLEALEATEEQKLALETEYANRLAEHQEKLAEEEMARQKAMNAYKVTSGLQALGALSKAMDEQSSVSKGIAIAETTWNTANAIMTAMKDTEMPYLARLANSITVGAMGLSQIKKIASTNPGKGGASGGGGTRGMSTPVQPSFNIVGDARQEALDDIDAERDQRPVKAYVVAGEVSTQQEADRNRVKNSRFL